METPNSHDAELVSSQALSHPSEHSSQPASTPHYVIATQDITADRDCPLGKNKRTGSVFKGFWNNSLVAVKFLSHETQVDLETLFDRIESWQILRHPHVLQVFGVSPLDANPPFIISRYYPNGDANEFLANNPVADRAKIMFECALGMQYLHGREIIHGSLKPTNILIAENGQACIADYGMIEIKHSGSACARYFSPEAWKGTISRPSDVFAFAMSSYEIFMSTPPWGVLSENHIYQLVVREGDRPDRLQPDVERKYGLTDKIWGIMEAAWQKEATLRQTFCQIVELWPTRSVETAVETLRPISPSNSVADSSHHQRFGLGDSQSTSNNVQVWRPQHNPGSKSLTNLPPPYRDRRIISPHLSRPLNTPSGPRSVSPPQSSASRSGSEDSPSLSTWTVSDINTLTTLTSAASSQRQYPPHASNMMLETQTIRSESQRGASSITGQLNAVLLAGALHAEVTEGRKQEVIDDYLYKTQILSLQSSKEAQKLVTAGIVPTVILLLKARAVDMVGLEIVLKTLGTLACDPITANTIHRTNTASTLIAILHSADSDNIISLSVWCINRVCRSSEVAAALIKQDIAGILVRKGLKGNLISSRSCAWCLGNLVYTDDLAEILAAHNIVIASVEHLRHITANVNATPEDKCAAIYLVARLARTTSLSKSLTKAGCVPLIVHHLSISEDPQVLQWSARAVGCLQRPNSSDTAKILLDAGSGQALARLPRVLPSEAVEPLASFAFAIQRLSCAEWGGGTRKALVEAGVVDSLLSALRTSADLPFPQVHIELALATSFLGDVGGTSIRKEIVRAGGIEILKRVSAAAKPEVAKVCNMAVTSITGNLWTRNAASAKTAMCHNWSGGCPEYQPDCPLVSMIDQTNDIGA